MTGLWTAYLALGGGLAGLGGALSANLLSLDPNFPLRYLVYVSRPERTVVGCVQFSSPAWRMEARDAWIGWDDATRERNLQRVVTNSRFLLLPWVRIQNLASVVLSLTMRRLGEDWSHR